MTDHAPGPVLRFAGVSLDCADPAVLADFYLALLGGETLWQSAGSVGIRVPGVVLAMQRAEEYRLALARIFRRAPGPDGGRRRRRGGRRPRGERRRCPG